jgi:hypothetical protein
MTSTPSILGTFAHLMTLYFLDRLFSVAAIQRVFGVKLFK